MRSENPQKVILAKMAGEHARYVWENFQTCRHLHPSLAELQSLPWSKWREEPNTWSTVANLICVMRTLAYGPSDVYKSRNDIVLQRIHRNPDCEAFTIRGDCELTLDLQLGADRKFIPFGPVHGLSTVFPMTQHSFDRYCRGEYSMMRLPTEVILPRAETASRSAEVVMITRCIYLPEIDLPGEYEFRGRVEFSGRSVITELARQIAAFLPKIKQVSDDGRVLFCGNIEAGSQSALIACPLSGRFKGGQFIDRLGFRLQCNDHGPFIDPDGFELYVANLAEITNVSSPQKEAMLKLARFIRQLNGQ